MVKCLNCIHLNREDYCSKHRAYIANPRKEIDCEEYSAKLPESIGKIKHKYAEFAKFKGLAKELVKPIERVTYPTEWYDVLTLDCKHILEGIELNKIEGYHKLGKRILTDILHFEKPEYGNKTLANLAEDLERSKALIYDAIVFAKKHPDFNTFMSKFSTRVENLTWTYIRKEILREKEGEEGEKVPKPPITCFFCGKRLSEELLEQSVESIREIYPNLHELHDFISKAYREILSKTKR